MRVNLREKKLKNGRRSLYLDFYPPIIVDGRKTRREFLRLYVYDKPKTEKEREENKEARMKAEVFRSNRQIELQPNPYNFVSPRRRNADFIEFFRKVVEEKKMIGPSARRRWQAVLKHLEEFTNGSCKFGQVDADFVERFRQYLLNCESYKCRLPDSKAALRRSQDKPRLAQNTAKEYFDRFISAVKEARERNYLDTDPTAKAKPIKLTTPLREFLTISELRALAQTDYEMPGDLRRAALFSALTGLRYSDIANLAWGNVRRDSDGETTLHIKIKKTGEQLILPISPEAREILGEAGKSGEKVFKSLKYDGMTNVYIERWMKAAGIERKITFHGFRRTYATGLITGGVDFYTVSGLLGHSDIRQTQIYARILDQKKREAANKISLK